MSATLFFGFLQATSKRTSVSTTRQQQAVSGHTEIRVFALKNCRPYSGFVSSQDITRTYPERAGPQPRDGSRNVESLLIGTGSGPVDSTAFLFFPQVYNIPRSTSCKLRRNEQACQRHVSRTHKAVSGHHKAVSGRAWPPRPSQAPFIRLEKLQAVLCLCIELSPTPGHQQDILGGSGPVDSTALHILFFPQVYIYARKLGSEQKTGVRNIPFPDVGSNPLLLHDSETGMVPLRCLEKRAPPVHYFREKLVTVEMQARCPARSRFALPGEDGGTGEAVGVAA